MVPGVWVYGGPSGEDFCILGGSKMEKNMKMKHEIGQISFSGALDE